MAKIFCKLAGPVSAVGSASCIAFDSSQVLFQCEAYYTTQTLISINVHFSIGLNNYMEGSGTA